MYFISAHHAGLLMVELPAGDEVLHANGVVAGALAVALVHVELVGLEDLIHVRLDAQAVLVLGQVDAAVHDLHGLLGQALTAFLPDPVGIDAVHLAGDEIRQCLHDANCFFVEVGVIYIEWPNGGWANYPNCIMNIAVLEPDVITVLKIEEIDRQQVKGKWVAASSRDVTDNI